MPGTSKANVGFAKAACHYAMRQGCAPVAVHLLYPQFLDDAVSSEREAGIRMGLRVLQPAKNCGYAERISARHAAGDR